MRCFAVVGWGLDAVGVGVVAVVVVGKVAGGWYGYAPMGLPVMAKSSRPDKLSSAIEVVLSAQALSLTPRRHDADRKSAPRSPNRSAQAPQWEKNCVRCMLCAQGDDLEPFDSEIERTFRRRRKEHKQKQQHQMADNQQIHIPIQPIGQMAARVAAPPEQQHERGEINEGDLPVSMFLTPIAAPMRSSIAYPDFGVNNFQIRPDWINLMSNTLQFYWLPHENSNTHICRFLRNCQNFHAPGVNEDAIKLRLFPFTLRDAALEWLDAEPHASITTWEKLIRKFCNKFFPPARVAKIKLEIQTFQQKEGESYHEAWNRFNELMRNCPNHGITQGNQVQYFYTGLTPLSKSQVDASAGRSIIGKSVQQTMDLFELIATTHSMFSSERVVPPKAAGMCELDSTTSTNARIAALTKQVELLVKLQTHGANAMMASSVCENCGRNHATESCMMLTSSEEQAPIKKLETQIGHIAQKIAERPQGTLPGNTMINPKEQLMAIEVVENDPLRAPVKVKAYVPPLPFSQRLRKKSMEQNIHVINTKREVQSPEITTERPKRKDDQEVIDEVTRVEKSAPNATENREGTETSAAKAPSLNKAYMPPIPFPQKLKKNKQDTNYEKFLDVLKKLQINVPFIDAILQISSYKKFLKEMLTKKRKISEFETVALTEESSARVQRKLPPKLKDPASFTLLVSIGNSYSSNTLCDTSASINLMSYSAYRKLGLGEVNSTSIMLQLPDRTITRSRGNVEDILVKVGNLIFSVDFIVLDIPENRDIPITLGRPFLATG
ncbi:uncharacterized protein LOC111381360 [Olea europaea var. sylvestris]|uniref:uncharacterized protein LOC111381360 n=1 Tax=Olea europaea var. sylvestris TaxID=158386 RepID=UPI000C1D78D5|nr:uncharacterized protein LOC111381360 [Olea europaea var. sylvestris]